MRLGHWRVAAVLLTFGLLASTNASPRNRAGSRLAEDQVRSRLRNGLRVVIVRDPIAPIATTVMNYLVGSDDDPSQFPGMAHAQEHMMFRGSPGLSADQLAEVSAAVGGDFDADTQNTVTQYYFTVPSYDLDIALHIESVRMRGVLDNSTQWTKEKGAINQEVMEVESNPFFSFYSKALQSVFAGTAYGQYPLGTTSSFENMSAGMLRSFFTTWYKPNNAILVIVGDVDPAAVLSRVRELFGQIPRGTVPSHPRIEFNEPVRHQILQVSTDFSFGLAYVCYRMPGMRSRDYAAVRVLRSVLNSRSGPLYALVPNGEAIVNAGFVNFMQLPKASLDAAFAGFPKASSGEVIIEKMKRAISQTLASGISQAEVLAAKQRELISAEEQRNSVPGLALLLSDSIVDGDRSPDRDIKAIQKVTVSDVNRLARLYLSPNNSIVAILTPRSGTAKPSTGFGAGGSESFAPTQVKTVPLPSWASNILTEIKVPAPNENAVTFTLRNRLKLIVQPEPIGTVNVYGEIANEPRVEESRGKEGVSEVLNSLLSYGTKTLDFTQFQGVLSSMGTTESSGVKFTLQALPRYFDRSLALLAENELHPRFTKSVFRLVQEQTAARLAGTVQSPSFVASQAVNAGLYFKGDPSLRYATAETVSTLTLNDVEGYYLKVFRPDLTNIVVIGDISPSNAKAEVEKYFGSWENVGATPQVNLPTASPNKASDTFISDTSRVQDLVELAETVGLTRADPERYALELGSQILGGAGFYATRLYRDLREERGLVYNFSTSLEIGRTRSVYRVIYGCDPQNVSRVRAIIMDDLESMQRFPVKSDELREAQALMVQQIPLFESSTDNVADHLLSLSTSEQSLDESTRAAKAYLTLRPSDIQHAMAKWLRPDDFVEVVDGPRP